MIDIAIWPSWLQNTYYRLPPQENNALHFLLLLARLRIQISLPWSESFCAKLTTVADRGTPLKLVSQRFSDWTENKMVKVTDNRVFIFVDA